MENDYYITIPVGKNLDECDKKLENGMDAVAKTKEHKSRKFWGNKAFSPCTKTEIKNMTKSKPNPKALDLPPDRFPRYLDYTKTRKINPARYAKVIKSFIKDYIPISEEEERKKLLEYTRTRRLAPTYEQAFCHPVYDGLEVVRNDIETASYFNRKVDILAVYEALIKELSTNQTEINP
jgi:hypothetical protein